MSGFGSGFGSSGFGSGSPSAAAEIPCDVDIDNHVEAAIDRLPAHNKSKTNIDLVLTALVDQIQDLEVAWCQLLKERTIDTAVGQQLDDLGKIVGQPRNGLDDDDYRRFLRARIAANNSEGLIADLLRVARGVVSDASLTLRFEEQFPAGIVLHVEGGSLSGSTASILLGFMRDGASGGVRILVHYLTAPPSESFTMGSVTTLTGPVLLGATVLPVVSTEGFADSGTLTVEDLGGSEEDVTYTSKSLTSFLGVSPLASAHAGGVEVKVADSLDLGFSDTAAPSTGGAYSSVIE